MCFEQGMNMVWSSSMIGCELAHLDAPLRK